MDAACHCLVSVDAWYWLRADLGPDPRRSKAAAGGARSPGIRANAIKRGTSSIGTVTAVLVAPASTIKDQQPDAEAQCCDVKREDSSALTIRPSTVPAAMSSAAPVARAGAKHAMEFKPRAGRERPAATPCDRRYGATKAAAR